MILCYLCVWEMVIVVDQDHTLPFISKSLVFYAPSYKVQKLIEFFLCLLENLFSWNLFQKHFQHQIFWISKMSLNADSIWKMSQSLIEIYENYLNSFTEDVKYAFMQCFLWIDAFHCKTNFILTIMQFKWQLIY